MNEKISDKPIREDKIKRLKEKILTEITDELNFIKEEMRECLSNDKAFNFLVKRGFALLNLKEYIDSEHVFQSFEALFPDKDIIIYKVSDRDLSIWLQDDYSLVHNFLYRAEDYEYDVFPLLNDRYFGYDFTNIFDVVLYEKKIKEQEESNTEK